MARCGIRGGRHADIEDVYKCDEIAVEWPFTSNIISDPIVDWSKPPIYDEEIDFHVKELLGFNFDLYVIMPPKHKPTQDVMENSKYLIYSKYLIRWHGRIQYLKANSRSSSSRLRRMMQEENPRYYLLILVFYNFIISYLFILS